MEWKILKSIAAEDGVNVWALWEVDGAMFMAILDLDAKQPVELT